MINFGRTKLGFQLLLLAITLLKPDPFPFWHIGFAKPFLPLMLPFPSAITPQAIG
jgi:hypothetical protein